MKARFDTETKENKRTRAANRTKHGVAVRYQTENSDNFDVKRFLKGLR